MINVFNRGEAWTEEARPKFMERLNGRLKCMSDALGDKEWLEDRFTIADLMLVTVLRQLRGGRTCSTNSPISPPSLLAAKRDPPSSARLRTSSRSLRRISRSRSRPEVGVPNFLNPRRRDKMTYFEGFLVPVPESQPRRLSQACGRRGPHVPRFRGPAALRGLGQRRSRGQGHRLPQGGGCQAGREGRLLLVRISRPGGPRRRQREDDERPAHEGNGRQPCPSTASA